MGAPLRSGESVAFINSTTGTTEEHRSNKHLARKHVSKYIREKRKAAETGSVIRSRPLRPAQEVNLPIVPRIVSQPLYEDLPPLSGALINTQVESFHDISRSTEYLLSFLHNVFTAEEVSSYFAAFCKHPIIYHGLHQISAGHRDSVTKGGNTYNSPRIVWHRCQTLRLLREKFARLDQEDLQLLVLAVVTLLRKTADSDLTGGGAPLVLPFKPHMPYADHLHVFGRQVTIEAHSTALYALVHRVGGAKNIEFPGMASACANHDLIDSSAYGIKPRLPNFWFNTFASLRELTNRLHPDIPGQDTAGSGFLDLKWVCLSDQIAATLTRLAIVDRMMESASMNRPSDQEYEWLLLARKDCHHNILSIPPWTELKESEKENASNLDYEACRIVAALYSTAVIFPVSPQFAWLNKLLDSLRQMLQSRSIHGWLQTSAKLAVWALFVASIAAYPTEHNDFFCTHLKEHLLWTRLVSFAEVRSVLTRFVWSDNACELGVTIVWNKLGFDKPSGTEMKETLSEEA